MTDTNVIKLAQPGTFTDALTEILRDGARALLTQAVETEVADFLGRYADLKTEAGRQRVVRHGHLPELCQSARVQCLEAAFDRSGSQDTPSPYRSAHALEVLCPKVLQIEEIAEQLPRALSDDNGIWFSDALKSCGEIWRLADDAALLRVARSNQVADYD